MMTKILQSLAKMFVDLLALTDQVFTALDGWGLVFGALTVLTIYRLLLSPLLGGSYVRFAERSVKVTNENFSEEDMNGD